MLKFDKQKLKQEIELYPDGDKDCNQCGFIIPITNFRTRNQHGKLYIVAKCRKCEQENNFIQYDRDKRRKRERKAANPERWKRKYKYQREWLKARPEYDKKYYHKDLKRSRDYSKKYWQNHLEKNRERANKAQRESVSAITDQYVKGLLNRQTGLAYNEIPTPLIKLKQLQILGKRTLKLKQNESHRTSQSNV